jgi:hypothetical protein
MPRIYAKQHERGQSLVEMALALPLLLLILSGLLDLGRVYFTYLTIQDAATEGAAYLSVNPFCPISLDDRLDDSVHEIGDNKSGDPAGPPGGSSSDCNDPNNSVFRAYQSSPLGQTFTLVNWNEAEIFYSVPQQPTIGVEVRIIIEYPYEMVTPVISTLVGEVVLRSDASQIVISGAPPAGG